MNGTNHEVPHCGAESTLFLVLKPISLKFILILSSHLRLGLPKGLFPAGVPVKILKALLPSSILIKFRMFVNILRTQVTK